MFGDIGTLSNEVFGDRHGQGSCTFFDPVGADLQRDQDREDAEERNGARDIQAMSASQETVVGRRILDGRIFRKHGWQARQ